MDNTYFTSDHVWIRLEAQDDGDHVATVGITRFAQESLGDIVFVDLPQSGAAVNRGEAACVIESTKTAADVLNPADGIVEVANVALGSDIGPLNDDPLAGGWLYRIRTHPADPGDVDWMDATQYQDFCGAA